MAGLEAAAGSLSAPEAFTVMNEFGAVRIRKIRTRNGERLEISSPRLGYSVQLDALKLEALSWQTEEFFSALLETPLGPESEINHEF
ncbi:dihydrodiol dehydrogenase [Rhodococcus sp. NPDC127530]|uniref:dihydrodiol dehydrogenase n=1 Tax=unclassified Rhodococcus (in: high G+C Gram-positive bacteria) TaxID=192944 RepID=UPI003635C4B1